MSESGKNLTVFFDGGCPICTKEITYYQKKDANDEINWVNVHSFEGHEVHQGLSKDDALKRFHVLDKEGRLLSGARAFAKLWQSTPGFKTLGHIIALPLLVQITELVYRLTLVIRPTMQRLWLRFS